MYGGTGLSQSQTNCPVPSLQRVGQSRSLDVVVVVVVVVVVLGSAVVVVVVGGVVVAIIGNELNVILSSE